MRSQVRSLSRPPIISQDFPSLDGFGPCTASGVWTTPDPNHRLRDVPPHPTSPNQAVFSLMASSLVGSLPLSHLKTARTMRTLSNMEISDAAISVLNTFSPTIPDDRPTCATTN